MKKALCKFLNAIASQAEEEIEDEIDEEIDDVMEVPDFVENSTNVYRTKRYIVKQALGMSDYTSYQVATYKHSKGDWTLLGTVADYDYVDSNSYFAKEWVQLDFDIIDLTFTKDNSWTVIPVVMTPIDIVPDVTPPTEWVDPQDFTAILKLILLILIIIVLLIVLWPVLPFIFKGIFWVIALPFKAIGKAIQKRKQEKHEQEVLEDLRQQFYKEGYDE